MRNYKLGFIPRSRGNAGQTLTELYPQNNAASVNEVASVGPWIATLGAVNIDSFEYYHGEYSIKYTSNVSSGGNARIEFEAIAGKKFEVTIWAKRGSGTIQSFQNWEGFVEDINVPITSTEWTEYKFNVTVAATGTVIIRIYANFGIGSAGNSVFFDKITIYQTSYTPPAVVDLFPQDNAASLADIASKGVWVANNSTIGVDGGDFIDGTWSLECIATSATIARAELDFNVENLAQYQIKIWAKRGIGVKQGFRSWVGFSNFVSTAISSTVWTEYVFNLTANITGAARIRIYPVDTTGGFVGDSVLFDKITIHKV